MKVSIEADEEDHPCERVASAITAAASATKDIAGGFFWRPDRVLWRFRGVQGLIHVLKTCVVIVQMLGRCI